MQRDINNNYAVTCDGIVVSKRFNRVLKQTETSKGYSSVCLGKGNWKLVHRLVAEAFIPNPNNFEVVNHIDFNKQNNSVKNLEWTTQKQNVNHSIGRLARGTLQGLSKLTDEQVKEIRTRFIKGSRLSGATALALEYGVHSSNIHYIIKRKTWRHIIE